jgi:hypothetical protein
MQDNSALSFETIFLYFHWSGFSFFLSDIYDLRTAVCLGRRLLKEKNIRAFSGTI